MKLKQLLFASVALLTMPMSIAQEAEHATPEGSFDRVTFTAFLAMVAFLLIAIWKGKVIKLITGGLDGRADKIRNELEEARRLRDEAAKILADAERKQREAEALADELIAQSKKDAKAMMAEARTELEQRLARREALAEERIKRAEAEAAEDVRRAAADAATQAAKTIMESQAGYFETAASEIEKSLS